MDTKLTLKLDKQVIDKAKEYALSHNRSLSGLIESYLKSLVFQKDSSMNTDIIISPFVKNLKSDVSIPDDFDYKKEYRDYLDEKYK